MASVVVRHQEPTKVRKGEVLKTFKSSLPEALPLLKLAKMVGMIESINPYSVPNYNMDCTQIHF